MVDSNEPLCDMCSKVTNNDQEYVGYGMMFCQDCIIKCLVRIPGGFRGKTLSEKSREDQDDRNQ